MWYWVVDQLHQPQPLPRLVADEGAGPAPVAHVASLVVEHLEAGVKHGAGAEAAQGEADEVGEGVWEPAAGAGGPRPLAGGAGKVVPGGGQEEEEGGMTDQETRGSRPR